jgi:hypothetical protein
LTNQLTIFTIASTSHRLTKVFRATLFTARFNRDANPPRLE